MGNAEYNPFTVVVRLEIAVERLHDPKEVAKRGAINLAAGLPGRCAVHRGSSAFWLMLPRGHTDYGD